MDNTKKVREQVGSILSQLYDNVLVEDNGDFYIPDADTVIFVRVFQRELNSSEIEDYFEEHQLSKIVTFIFAPVLVEVQGSGDLFKWVATEGQSYNLGRFKLDPWNQDNSSYALIFTYELAGDEINLEQFKTVLLAVHLATLDNIDVLGRRFGGNTYADYFLSGKISDTELL